MGCVIILGLRVEGNASGMWRSSIGGELWRETLAKFLRGEDDATGPSGGADGDEMEGDLERDIPAILSRDVYGPTNSCGGEAGRDMLAILSSDMNGMTGSSDGGVEGEIS